MQVHTTKLSGVLFFTPTPHYDNRGFFTRTFDTQIFDDAVADNAHPATGEIRASDFTQDSQSRSGQGVIRGMHGRSGRGEAKLVRCARGQIDDVLVDIRPNSPTYGQATHFLLDDENFAHLLIPPGFLHGFQVLSETADVCYRINRAHDPTEDIAVAYNDPDLAIAWQLPVTTVSPRDEAAGPFSALQT